MTSGEIQLLDQRPVRLHRRGREAAQAEVPGPVAQGRQLEQPPRQRRVRRPHPDLGRHQAGPAVRVPVQGRRKAAAEHAGKLLGLAPDDVTRARIGDLIARAKRGAPLPDIGTVSSASAWTWTPASPA